MITSVIDGSLLFVCLFSCMFDRLDKGMCTGILNKIYYLITRNADIPLNIDFSISG